MSNEEYQSETLLLTIRAQLEREEKRKIIWQDANDGPWNRINPDGKTSRGLMKYFEPSYPAAHDELCQPIASYSPTDPK
jgi:hypothetical protein